MLKSNESNCLIHECEISKGNKIRIYSSCMQADKQTNRFTNLKNLNMEWIFEGIGTAIITLIVGFLTGGAVGYRIGIKKNNITNQKQNAEDNASQIQIGRDYNGK